MNQTFQDDLHCIQVKVNTDTEKRPDGAARQTWNEMYRTISGVGNPLSLGVVLAVVRTTISVRCECLPERISIKECSYSSDCLNPLTNKTITFSGCIENADGAPSWIHWKITYEMTIDPKKGN